MYLYLKMIDDMRWKIYNLAFRIFGRTKLWPRLGHWIWW